jgi:hypothetical protein
MKKIREMRQSVLKYINTWKYLQETPFISKKQKCHVFLFPFFLYKIGEQKGGRGLGRGVGTTEGEGYKGSRRVSVVEYYAVLSLQQD